MRGGTAGTTKRPRQADKGRQASAKRQRQEKTTTAGIQGPAWNGKRKREEEEKAWEGRKKMKVK